MATKKTKEVVSRDKKNINLKPIVDKVLSYIALILLAGFAYEGLTKLVKADPAIQTGIALLVVILLLKTACKK